MTTFFTSDTHFNHSNVIKHCNRPFETVEEMNRTLINNWNGKVKSTDTIYFIGDFAWNNVSKFKSRLNGNIIFISGNHDSNVDIQDLILLHNGKYWHCAHKPIDCYGEYNLCGHVHEKWKVKVKDGNIWINVGVDVWDYAPISWKEINKEISVIGANLKPIEQLSQKEV